jgi:hypothetical protein
LAQLSGLKHPALPTLPCCGVGWLTRQRRWRPLSSCPAYCRPTCGTPASEVAESGEFTNFLEVTANGTADWIGNTGSTPPSLVLDSAANPRFPVSFQPCRLFAA